MKKILLLILLFICPLIVKAETSLDVYNAKVINKNGITYKEWNGSKSINKTLPYYTEITVSISKYSWYDEETKKQISGSSITGYSNKIILYDLKLEDVSLNKENYKDLICNLKETSNIFCSKDNTNLKVLNPNGVSLKAGPSDDFPDVTIIPNNKDLKADYIISEYDMDYDIYYWAY